MTFIRFGWKLALGALTEGIPHAVGAEGAATGVGAGADGTAGDVGVGAGATGVGAGAEGAGATGEGAIGDATFPTIVNVTETGWPASPPALKGVAVTVCVPYTNSVQRLKFGPLLPQNA